MKFTALFFVITLIVSAFSATSDLKVLESSKLGRNLMDLIQIQLGSKEPVQTLLNMLNEMADNLAKEQDASDTAHQSYQNDCTNDISFYNAEIAEAKTRIEKAQNELIRLRPELSLATENLASNEAALKAFQEELDQATRTRATEAEEYNLKVQEHENALSVLHEVAGLFQNLLAHSGAPAFLQTRASVFAQVASTLKSSVPKLRKGYRGIFNILIKVVEKGPQANQDIVKKILDLIRKIRENVESSQKIERDAENQRVEAFNSLSENLNREITTTRSTINDLNNKIENLKTSIASNEEELKAQNERLQTREAQLDDRVRICNNEQETYGNERTKRTEERNVVNQVTDIIKTKLSTLREYIKQRTANVA